MTGAEALYHLKPIVCVKTFVKTYLHAGNRFTLLPVAQKGPLIAVKSLPLAESGDADVKA
ncbi:hypothetical protein EH105704_01_09280 [Atlantibacter hermannii NBRC 105704]|uniref:Uncharacterized protein n=1 Tax=Atlantibacter hermannii NBRC 105704 TaxID=1115512 RepID=H5UYD5_ATLHE|nr:hypothetical protein EH105704_01_09280 [Atlantibacter hermannii NBRC 105704]